ncbi:MAG: hypothetical protein UT66_C0012G0028 [candidate division CPR2 bacterium GW2011_GWC1_39_9]|uniref:Uncharacterized protein n=1 Tax=candidate division CPR2 bacterium GW2011_GWC2_39_10 TaxID=1618345 RepID=A0A0G0M1U2_UNCC2|nr:MAG: hypothetical protein UT18_C0011G0001 [candidate division CPR2 bacterium GW2011_GWC2_39_10]KKR35187.1 MAG: hypothetical protein UT66_C0012G0028 [candidate division CPR2 bacterium GW2011_GWC1_39_9]
MKATIIGYKGGYLNGMEISDDLSKIFVAQKLIDGKKQIQQTGIDLRVKAITKTWSQIDIRPPEIPFNKEGWVFLPAGSYWFEFHEQLKNPDYVLELHPRSTLMRAGLTVAIGTGKLILADDIFRGAGIRVLNPYGFWLEQESRVSQALLRSESRVFFTPHNLIGISRPLTVDKIFVYKKPGRLGVNKYDCDIDVVSEIEDSIVLNPGECCFLRFKETIAVGRDEVVVTCNDFIRHSLYAMGAIADPGYMGKLHANIQHASISFPNSYRISIGDKILRLKKFRITPVPKEKLYNGSYKGLGLEKGAKTGDEVEWDL